MGEQKTLPAVIVIFGITGDLAKRKLLPALYRLHRDDLLPPGTQIIGVTRQNLSKTDVLAPLDRYTRSRTQASGGSYARFRRSFHLQQMNMADSSDYAHLLAKIEGLEQKQGSACQRLYYLSIPPSVFDEVIAFMGKNGLHKATAKGHPLPALLIEKPFGYDFASAEGLVKATKRYFKENQIYRIDHYLAKEMAQNVLDFRFHNPLFSSVWGGRYISRVEISATEAIGIENRANFYEQTGALRDLIQSHLLQLLTLIATERPKSLSSSADVHNERLKVLRSVSIPKAYEVADIAVRGQYRGYQDDVNNLRSQVETFAALKLEINNPRWKGVPFVLKTGKALNRKSTKIDIWFGEGERHNRLTMQLQPNEGVYLELQVKRPGFEHFTERIQMDFGYDRAFPGITSPEAYERVLLDAVRQDQTLFASSEEVLCQWRIIEPVLHEWAKSAGGLALYEPGSAGPDVTW